MSMFYLETRGSDGKLNGMEIHKLKHKLGTRQLPTAELLLDGAVAHLVSYRSLSYAKYMGITCTQDEDHIHHT